MTKRTYVAKINKNTLSMTEGKVGIFFVVNGELIIDTVPVAQGELYGDAFGFSGHHDFWQALVPQNPTENRFSDHAYDYYPRGRVVYFKESDRFLLYADRCLTNLQIEKVALSFYLPYYKLARDEHYQCAKCNPDYLDI